MTRHWASDTPAHTHLRDATHHLANARRSFEAAATVAPNVQLRLATLAAERNARRLGKLAARAQRVRDCEQPPVSAARRATL